MRSASEIKQSIPGQERLDRWPLRLGGLAPQWFGVCRDVLAEDSSDVQRGVLDNLATEVARAWATAAEPGDVSAARACAASMESRLRHTLHAIHLAALEGGSRGQPTPPSLPDDEQKRHHALLANELMRQAARNPGPDWRPPVLQQPPAESLQMTVALVPQGRRGGVALNGRLTLWRWPVPPDAPQLPRHPLRLVPAPVQTTVHVDRDFQESADMALAWLNRVLQPAAPPGSPPRRDWMLAYEVTVLGHTVHSLGGGSASASLALGAAWLMRDWLPGALGDQLRALPQRVVEDLALSAVVLDDEAGLGRVGGEDCKLKGLSDFLAAARSQARSGAAQAVLHLEASQARQLKHQNAGLAVQGHCDLPALVSWLHDQTLGWSAETKALLDLLRVQAQAVPLAADGGAVASHRPAESLYLPDDAEPATRTAWQDAIGQVARAATGKRCAEPAGYALHRWAWWAQLSQGQVHQDFVSLGLDMDQAHPQWLQDCGLHQGPHDSLARVVAKADRATSPPCALLLLGEPGAGKSWLLQHYEQASTLRLLRLLGCAEPGEVEAPSALPPASPEWPIFVPLRDLEPLPDELWNASADARVSHVLSWLRHRLHKQYPLFDELHRRLGPAERRSRGNHQRWQPLRLIVDGLNELPAPDSTAREKLARELVWGMWDELDPGLPMLLGTRSHHPFRDLTRGRPLADRVLRVQVLAWSEAQMQAYLRRRLPGSRADTLWGKLKAKGSEAALALCRIPLNLAAQCDLVHDLGDEAIDALAHSQARLFTLWLLARLERELREKPDSPLNKDDGLLTPAERRHLQDRSNWLSMPRLPAVAEPGRLLGGLRARAEAHWLTHADQHAGQRGGVAVRWQEVQRWALDEQGWSKAQFDQWLSAARDLQVLAPGEEGDKIAFRHHVWGEFLAAQSLMFTGLQDQLAPGDDPTPDDLQPERLARLRTLLQPPPLPGGRGAEEELAVQREVMQAAWADALTHPVWQELMDPGVDLPWDEVEAEMRSLGLSGELSVRSQLQQLRILDGASAGALAWWRLGAAGSLFDVRAQWSHRSSSSIPWPQDPACWIELFSSLCWPPFRREAWRRIGLALGERTVELLQAEQGRLTEPPAGPLDEVLPLALGALRQPRSWLHWLQWLLSEGLWGHAARTLLSRGMVQSLGGTNFGEDDAPVRLLRQQLMWASLPLERPENLEGLHQAVGPWLPKSRRNAWPTPQAQDLRVRVQAARLLGELCAPDVQLTPGYEPLRYEAMPPACGEVRSLLLKRALWVPVGSPGSAPIRHHVGDAAWRDAQPCEVTLGPFLMAAYPVTVGEYHRFLQDPDSQNPAAECWQNAGPAAQDWLVKQTDVGRRRREPWSWGRGDRRNPLLPVVGVTWFEATAYAAWLHAQASAGGGWQAASWAPGHRLRLPTEWEWEVAMRQGGQPGQRWPGMPSGHARPGPLHFNHGASGWGSPLPVGLFGGSANGSRLFDGAGQVWEWCANAYWPDLAHFGNHHLCNGQLDMCSDAFRCVQRGGSFNSAASLCALSFRNHRRPGYVYENCGFRLVVGEATLVQNPGPYPGWRGSG